MAKKKILAVSLLSLIVLISGVNLVIAAGQGRFCDSCGQAGDSNCGTGLECLDNKCRYDCPDDQICIQNPLKSCSFEDLTNAIINFIFYIALALAPLMIIIGAGYFITALGDTKRIETGKNLIIYTLIGFTIVLFAKGLVSVIKQVIGG